MYITCQKCGKRITDPESRRRGYGPECWDKICPKVNINAQDDDVLPGQMNVFDYPDLIPETMQKGRKNGQRIL